MALYRRGKSKIWYLKITRPDGSQHRASTGTENKQLATELHDKLKAEMWEHSRLGIKPNVLFTEVVKMFLEDKGTKRKGSTLDGYVLLLDWWCEQFKGLNVRDITQDLIVRTIKKKERDTSGATCNRYLAALRATLRLAHLKYQLTEVLPKFFMYDEPRERVRFLKPDEIARLLEVLPPHLSDMAAFSLATGLRQANVLSLKWHEVDLVNKVIVIDGDKMKNGQTFGLPLPQAAVDIITRQIGKHHEAVFTFRGKPVKCISNDTWKACIKRAGIEDFRWHDMRHTWASTLVQAGVPDSALQVLGAWETPGMVKKYAHHATESVRSHAEVVDAAIGNALARVVEVVPMRERLRLVG
jgi:integrase